jgi:hypothetical protein
MSREVSMQKVVYRIVTHDGGYAYRVGSSISETFATREDAVQAAQIAAAEQRAPGPSEAIEFEDEQGRWHTEQASGGDRPQTEVEEGGRTGAAGDGST